MSVPCRQRGALQMLWRSCGRSGVQVGTWPRPHADGADANMTGAFERGAGGMLDSDHDRECDLELVKAHMAGRRSRGIRATKLLGWRHKRQSHWNTGRLKCAQFCRRLVSRQPSPKSASSAISARQSDRCRMPPPRSVLLATASHASQAVCKINWPDTERESDGNCAMRDGLSVLQAAASHGRL